MKNLNIKDRLEYVWDEIKSIPINIKILCRSIKNVIDYAPLTYKDRDWDYIFLYDMLIFKLNRMEKCIADGSSLNCYKKADKILEIKCLLEQVRDEHIWYEDIDCEMRRAKNEWYETVSWESGMKSDKKKFDKYHKLKKEHEARLKQMRKKAFKMLGDNVDEMWD